MLELYTWAVVPPAPKRDRKPLAPARTGGSPAPPRGASRIATAARRLLAAGAVGDAGLRESGRVGAAIPVMLPGGGQHSWFVPVTVADRLAGFLLLRPDGTLRRYSGFPRRPGDLAGWPAAADWLDPERVRARALGRRRPDERAGEPFLSFDRVPERLAWAVPLTGTAGTRLIYVAGETVFEASSGGGLG